MGLKYGNVTNNNFAKSRLDNVIYSDISCFVPRDIRGVFFPMFFVEFKKWKKVYEINSQIKTRKRFDRV